jgi:hypothetical protein
MYAALFRRPRLAFERDLIFLRKVPGFASILIGNLTKEDAHAEEGSKFFAERVAHPISSPLTEKFR